MITKSPNIKKQSSESQAFSEPSVSNRVSGYLHDFNIGSSESSLNLGCYVRLICLAVFSESLHNFGLGLPNCDPQKAEKLYNDSQMHKKLYNDPQIPKKLYHDPQMAEKLYDDPQLPNKYRTTLQHHAQRSIKGLSDCAKRLHKTKNKK